MQPTYFTSSAYSLNNLNYLFKNNVIGLFPNLSTALCIYLALPVLPKNLKFIKNYLKTTMTQEEFHFHFKS